MKKKAAAMLSIALITCCLVPRMFSLADTLNETEMAEHETELEEKDLEQEHLSEEEKKQTEEKEKAEEETEEQETEEEDNKNREQEKEQEKQEEAKLEDFNIKGKKLYAYSGDSKIVRIPDYIEEIADEALKGNRTVEEIYLPDSVQSVGFGAFSDMHSLKKVHMGNGFDADLIDIFMGSMNIEEYETDEQSGDFYAKEGVLYVDSEVGVAAYYPAAKVDMVYTVPENVSILFLNGNQYIQTLSISKNVKRIDFNGGIDVDIVPARLSQITVNSNNHYFYVDSEGALRDSNSDIVVFFPAAAEKNGVEK